MQHRNTHVYRAPAGPSRAALGIGVALLFLGAVLGIRAVDDWADRAEYASARPCEDRQHDGCIHVVDATVIGSDEEQRRTKTTHVVRVAGTGTHEGWLIRAELPGRDPAWFDRFYEGQRVVVQMWKGNGAVRVDVPHIGAASTLDHPHVDAVRATLNALLALAAGVAMLVLRTRRDGRLWLTAMPLCAGAAAMKWVSAEFGAYDPYRLGATFVVTALGAALVNEIDLRRTAREASLPTWSAARPATP